MGSPTVFIGGKMAARMGDPTAHGGVITVGFPTVLIGEVGMGGAAPSPPKPPGLGALLNDAVEAVKSAVAAQIQTLKEAAKSGTPFCTVCAKS